MINTDKILPPGGTKQFEHLLEQNIPCGKRALIIGPACEYFAIKLLEYFSEINIIVDNYYSLIQSRMRLNDNSNIKASMMDFAHSNFENNYFDLIYAQASISTPERKEILKEILRIMKSDCLICIGEIVSLKNPVPLFVKDIWERSGLTPLLSSELKCYYEKRKFQVISERDISTTLNDYYTQNREMLSKVSKEERDENKKYYSQIKHESDVYLKLGGNKYIGYKSLIMRIQC